MSKLVQSDEWDPFQPEFKYRLRIVAPSGIHLLQRCVPPPCCGPSQFDGEGVEAEADSVVNQVLAEIGLDVDGKMMDAPTNAPAIAKPTSTAEDAKLDAQTEAMLAQLNAL